MTAKTAPKITLWEFFQQLGKTFMLPVALLSFCGIMLGIGSSLSSHDVLTLLPWLDMPLLQAIFIWMSKVGSFAFSFLPVMFCIAIPLGLARENKGVAAFAGFVGYAVMNLAVNFWLTAKGILPTTDARSLRPTISRTSSVFHRSIPGSSGRLSPGLSSGCCMSAFTTFACRTPWPSSAAPASCRSSPPWCWVWSGWRSRWCGRSSHGINALGR